MVGASAAALPERPSPGAFWGDYPQRDGDRLRGRAQAWLGRLRALDGRRGALHAQAVLARADALERCARPLAELADAVRARLARGRARARDRDRSDALALACLAARQVLGQSPFPTQVRAAAVMLDDGLAELATGEGKTLALALAAAARALAGVPVHVVTVNDYLVARDAERLAPFFRALGLVCDRVLAADGPERRRLGWSRDVVYCTAHELMFDWLRDRLAGADRAGLAPIAASLRGRAAPAPLLRGLCSAFLDEADGLLVDDATLPCVLAQADGDPADGCADALRIAATLWEGRDYLLEPAVRRASLTDVGRERVARAADTLEGPWRLSRRRDALLAQALAALHLYRCDRDYLVRDGRIDIVDPATGRVAVGRAWSDGLHQMIEQKERAAGTLPHRPVIQVTPSQLFPRYWRLGGLSATLVEEAGELAAGYGTSVVPIPPRTPSRRIDLPPRLFADPAARDAALVARVAELARAGRPVLVAVRDVAESASLAAALAAAGLSPAVLDARHEDREAAVVEAAGQAGRVTVATDMAGRGTDIVLDEQAIAAGGLAIVTTHIHASGRLERQLRGRAARRGEPGCAQAWLVAGAPLSGAVGTGTRLPFVGPGLTGVPSGMAQAVLRALQALEAGRARRRRRRLRELAADRARRQLVGRVDD